MTRDEMLAEAARITEEHGRRYAGHIPLEDADSRPHAGTGGKSDYAQHVHLVSAPPEIDDKLNRQLAALLDLYRNGPGDPEKQAEAERRYNFRDYWLHGKGLARWATWDELTAHLTKFLSAKAAKRIARQWFKERFGVDPAEETGAETARARPSADHDGTDLHAYWTRGEGLAKWRGSPHPWQTLHAHLAKYITDPHKLDATTSAWFIDVFGYAAGSDRNRVEHGHKPRGKRIGPG